MLNGEAESIYHAPKIANKLRHLKSDVPDALMNAAKDDATRYLLKQASIADQQKVIIAETLDQILFQTTNTNGKVAEQARQIAVHERQLQFYKFIGGAAMLILPPLGMKIVEVVWGRIFP
jgi:hypothetical protein